MFPVKSIVSRHSSMLVKEVLEDAPLLVVEGARQVGKSTLLRQALSDDTAVFTTLDDELTLEYAQNSPQAFLSQAPNKTLVIDEAQRAPRLALALKKIIDEDRRPGRFAVTGSADLLRLPEVSDSLAGRAESVKVHPFSQGEINQRKTPEDWVTWLRDGMPGGTFSTHENIRERVIRGGYPEPLKREEPRRINNWFASYLSRIITHDARELGGTSDFSEHLDNLFRLIANQGHSELVKSKLARQLGVSENALINYLNLSSTMFLIDTLPSWGIGYSGRTVRKPKISLCDTGLASYLSGLTVEKSLMVGGQELFGGLLESFVVNELQKQATWAREAFRLFHYRNRETEVDIVLELPGGEIILIEVKSALSLDSRAWQQLNVVTGRFRDRVVASVVLYMGDKSAQIQASNGTINVLPISLLWEHP